MNFTFSLPELWTQGELWWSSDVNILLPISLIICFGAQKYRLIGTGRSTNDMYFGLEIRKLFFWYALFT